MNNSKELLVPGNGFQSQESDAEESLDIPPSSSVDVVPIHDVVDSQLPEANSGMEAKVDDDGFRVDSSAITCIPANEQADELKVLGLSVYDQTVFEQGVMDQLDQAVEKMENERQKKQYEKELQGVVEEIRTVSQELKRLDKILQMAAANRSQSQEIKRNVISIKQKREMKTKQLQKLKAKRKFLNHLTGVEDGQDESNIAVEDEELDDETKNQLEQVFGNQQKRKKETERERLIRTGHMTPFGTVINSGASTSRSAAIPVMTDFERFLVSQSEQRDQCKKPATVTKATKIQPVIKHSPRKKKRLKVDVGTEIAGQTKAKNRKSMLPWWVKQRPPAEIATVDFEEKAGSSGSEYVPSEGEWESDGNEDFFPKDPKRGKKKSLHEIDEQPDVKLNKEVNTRKQRVVDDGDWNRYVERIKRWKKEVAKSKHSRILEGEELDVEGEEEFEEFEGGYRISRTIWKKLYPYQQTCVRWLWELHCQEVGGIVGDEMGLGKTIQIIAYLSGLSSTRNESKDSESTGLGPVLIVCPTTVMHQWVREFHAWWPALRVAILHDSGSHVGSRANLIKNLNKRDSVLVTSYGAITTLQDTLAEHDWHYVILDEGHKIRNPDAKVTLACKRIRTPHRLILSGSPLQNNLKELWSLFDFIFPGKLGTLPVFMQQFAVPITQGGYATASQIQVQTAYKCATVLRDAINPYLLRRMKADVQMSINLPGKNEQVLFCRLTDEQREAYRFYLQSDEAKRILEGNYKVFVGLINLRKICNHPDLFTGGPKIFHTVADDELAEDQHYGYWARSGKLIVVESILKLWKKQGNRVLLFSQSKQMLDILERFVRNKEYTYLRMDGGTSIASRQPLVNKFNQDQNIFIFLLTTRVGGLGVNLIGANRVVIFDPDWNPSTDLQARERAWRIGQHRDVTIYRLLTVGTIEEKIYHRQIFKQFLTNRVLKDPRQKRFFKSNDLHELFTLQDTEGTQGTETSAIFAGMNTEVKLRKKSHREKSLGESSKEKTRKEEIKKKKKHRDAVFEGKVVKNLVKKRTYRPQREEEKNPEQASAANQDEYVLQKLFSKSGVHSALKHDKILESGEPDYMLVEAEAERVARDAVKVLKQSRRQCFRAEAGVPNWTGSRTTRPRFGQKRSAPTVTHALNGTKNGASTQSSGTSKAPKMFTGEEPTSSSTVTSGDLLARMRARNQLKRKLEQGGGASDDSDNDEVSGIQANVDTDSGLLDDIRNLIAFQCATNGQATTAELLDRFRNRLPPENSALFKAMLSQICVFNRLNGIGVWRLKEEFR